LHKIYISILLVFWFILHYWFVHALTNSEKWAILERFQEQQYELLFKSELSDFSWEYSDVFSISKKLDLYNSMSNDILEERQDAQEKYTDLVSHVTSLEQQLNDLNASIEQTQNKVKNINLDVIRVKWEIEENSVTIEELKQKIEENKEVLLDYLIYIYKKSNTSYEWTEIDNLKSILLNWEDIWDMINDLYYKWIIQVTGQNLIDTHRSYISELYIKKVNLEKKEQELKELRKQWIIEQKILQDKKDFQQKLLEESKWEQEYYEQYLEDKIELESEVKLKVLRERIRLNSARNTILEKYGCDFIDVTQDSEEVRTMQVTSEKCYNINRMLYWESQLANNSENVNENKTHNVFDWPVNPYLGVSAFYRDPSYRETFWADHNAIDVVIPQWTPIEAPMDWYVLYLNPPTSEAYSYLALKHYDWYITVYWHLSEILVDEYQYVEKWEIIARTWWEFWTAWAWYITTGPHLHLEVFKDQEYIDPLTVLDNSYLKFETLPDRYQTKYLIDYQLRKWYAYKNIDKNSKTFYLEWNNEIERQKNLISKYAVWSFNNWQMWIDESLDWNIDPSLVMCIWLAESGLWKNLSSPYNIWNVWNNDRWDRKWFENARQWVYAIIQTLNNRYFKDYNDLSKLSWAWRQLMWLPSCREQWEYCYATDTNHWHNNVTKCLTHLKWSFVPDTYNFRLLK